MKFHLKISDFMLEAEVKKNPAIQSGYGGNLELLTKVGIALGGCYEMDN